MSCLLGYENFHLIYAIDESHPFGGKGATSNEMKVSLVPFRRVMNGNKESWQCGGGPLKHMILQVPP